MARSIRLLALWMLTTPAWGRELTLEEALEHVSRNRDLQTAERREEAARASSGVAHAAFDPTFVASTRVSGTDASGFVAGYPMDSHSTTTTSTVGLRGSTSTGTSWEIGADLGRDATTTVSSLGGVESEQVRKTWNGLVDLTVSQDVLAPFRQSSSAIAARQADERIDTAALASRGAEQDALVAIASAWWSWSSSVRLAENADRAVSEAESLEARTRVQHEEGLVARLEVSRVAAERLAAEREAQTAWTDARSLADQLLLVMGEAPGQDIEPGGTGEIAGGDLELAASLERALAANPTVLSARAEVEIAENALRDGRRAGLPTLTASGSLGMASLSDTAMEALTDLAADGLPRWAVGLDLSVPIGGRAARGTRDGAQADLDIAQLALASAEETVRAQVRAAVDAVGTARSGVELATARLEVTRETEAGEAARVEEGASRLDDLITARNARLKAESDLVDAEAQRARAELDLLRLEGRLGGRDAV
ncbi:MAG: TolC family protein [Myxococcota bacterium]